MTRLSLSAFLVACLGLPVVAMAQPQEAERIPFAGGELTITQTEDYDRILAFDGRELARDYMVFFDRTADVRGTEVAFFSVGAGGNACAPAVVMVWEARGEVTSESTEEDCRTPAPAITDHAVFFVPYLMPGATADVLIWTPDDGFSLHGRLAYAPKPGTDWDNFVAAAVYHPLDFFKNAAILDAAQALLGDDFADVVAGLGVSSEPDEEPGGLVTGRGCVPHACSLSDTFMVIDPTARQLFFAQQGEPTRFWPSRAEWPAEAAALIPSDF
ncbi:MAG: hypothetical protein ACK4F5_06200 [Aliihoeflea sp.]